MAILMVAMSASVVKAEEPVDAVDLAMINVMDELVGSRMAGVALSIAIDALNGQIKVCESNYNDVWQRYVSLLYPKGIEYVNFAKVPTDWEVVYPKLYSRSKKFVMSNVRNQNIY
jgi:hypothetical protein